jgi:hypothetical protein
MIILQASPIFLLVASSFFLLIKLLISSFHISEISAVALILWLRQYPQVAGFRLIKQVTPAPSNADDH